MTQASLFAAMISSMRKLCKNQELIPPLQFVSLDLALETSMYSTCHRSLDILHFICSLFTQSYSAIGHVILITTSSMPRCNNGLLFRDGGSHDILRVVTNTPNCPLVLFPLDPWHSALSSMVPSRHAPPRPAPRPCVSVILLCVLA